MFRSVRPHVVEVQAPAKVNLFLRVVARRPDGYHDIETVMVKLRGLCDTLTLELVSNRNIGLTLHSAYPRSLGAQPIPVNEENLVLRAATLLQRETGCHAGAKIVLTKRIPSAAGLGGGSSDAACTLTALNQLWGLHLDQGRLLAFAAELGSDVPFFLAESACVLCTGRGEVLAPISTSEPLSLVVARPSSGLATPAVYRACRPESASPAAQDFLAQWRSAGWQGVARCLHNSLQAPAESLNSDVIRLRELFERQGVVAHQMTGSGSAYFALCSSARHACCVAQRLRASGVPWVHATTTVV